jgi:hypothetical protein
MWRGIPSYFVEQAGMKCGISSLSGHRTGLNCGLASLFPDTAGWQRSSHHAPAGHDEQVEKGWLTGNQLRDVRWY